MLANSMFYDDCDPTSQFSQCLYPDGPRVNATLPGGVPLVSDIFGLSFALSPLQLEQILGFPPGFSLNVTDALGNPLTFDRTGPADPPGFRY